MISFTLGKAKEVEDSVDQQRRKILEQDVLTDACKAYEGLNAMQTTTESVRA